MDETIPTTRILNNVRLVERRAKYGRMSYFAAITAADTAVRDVSYRAFAERVAR